MAKSSGPFSSWLLPLLLFNLIASTFLAFGVFHTAIAVKKIALKQAKTQSPTITNVDYKCDGGKNISAVYFEDKVELNLANGKSLLLMQAVSGSGVRYTNSDESITFWNKGTTAFMEQGPTDAITYNNCNQTASD
jgi:membrane-bound inhibitor of C-type lysozyme